MNARSETAMYRLTTRKPHLIEFAPVALMAIVLAALLAFANVSSSAQADGQELTISASFSNKQQINTDEQIQLRLSRPLQPSEGRLAVLIGQIDMTSLFTAAETELNYAPGGLLLPAGETQLTVYLVSPGNEWKQIAQFALVVSERAPIQAVAQPAGNANNRSGFERLGITPSLTIGMKSRPAESHFPDTNRPDRPTFTDFTLQSSVQSSNALGAFAAQTQFDIVGSSFRKEALRFGELGNAAPYVDLSSYLMQFQMSKAKVMLGHVSTGTSRHLINNFTSRGVKLSFPIASRGDISIAAMNGTSIVGWSNFFGLNRRKHQILSGTLGLEFIPERPGGLRIEGSALYGSLLPINNFNQGNITDTEQSRGLGVRLIASNSSQRLRLDVGFARSRFDNPTDPLLNQEFNVVPVRADSRNARYLDASYDLLKGFKLSENRQANVTLNYRHERIDPLFRSVAASIQADRLQNQLEVVSSISDINMTFAYHRFNDNLDDIPSILKTLSRRASAMLGVPLGSLFGNAAAPSPWLPRLSYSFERLHQFGASFPVNSGFDSESQVPDQISTNQLFAAEWQLQKLRFGYRFNQSFQDNRQVGREQADLRNIVNAFTVGLSPASVLDMNFELNAESANNREQNRTDRNYRLGSNINWRMTERAALALTVSTIFAGDVARTTRSRNAEFDLQWSYRFMLERSRFRKVQGQFFVKYANRYARSLDNLFGLSNLTKLQTFNIGLNFTFF